MELCVCLGVHPIMICLCWHMLGCYSIWARRSEAGLHILYVDKGEKLKQVEKLVASSAGLKSFDLNMRKRGLLDFSLNPEVMAERNCCLCLCFFICLFMLEAPCDWVITRPSPSGRSQSLSQTVSISLGNARPISWGTLLLSGGILHIRHLVSYRSVFRVCVRLPGTQQAGNFSNRVAIDGRTMFQFFHLLTTSSSKFHWKNNFQCIKMLCEKSKCFRVKFVVKFCHLHLYPVIRLCINYF